MQYQEFIERVQGRTGLSEERARGAISATFTTLGEYLVWDEAPDLASQLPQEISEPLTDQPTNRPKLLSYEDFMQRLAENEGTNEGAARDHVSAVMGVLQEAVSEGELEDLKRQFPSEFDQLFR